MAEAERNVSACLVRGLTVLQMLQLPSGQMATFQHSETSDGQRALAPAALPSAQVHDALSGFDPSARATAASAALQAVAPPQRPWFASSVRQMRRRLRGYLRSERQPDGSWRRQGRGSGSDADLATTAWASLAMAESSGASSRRNRYRRLSERFAKAGRGADRGGAEDLQAMAHRLGLAALAADPARIDDLRQKIVDRIHQPLDAPTAMAVLRAWRQAGLDMHELRSGWRPEGPVGDLQPEVTSAAERAAAAHVTGELGAWSQIEPMLPSLQADLFAAPNAHVANLRAKGEATSVALGYAWAMSTMGRWAATSGRCRRDGVDDE